MTAAAIDDAIFGTDIRGGTKAASQRPGDFHRHAKDKRPRVTHPTELIKDGTRGKYVYYARPSGIGKDLENSYALDKWNERRMIYGAGDPNVRQIIRELDDHEFDSPEWCVVADKAVVAARKAGRATEAAERGTHMHAVTEDEDYLGDLPEGDDRRDVVSRMEAGEELGIPRHVQEAMLAAWRRMLDEYGIKILAIELPVVHDGWAQAGTLDRIGLLTRDISFDFRGGRFVLPAGTIIVLDLKAGKIRFDPTTGLIKYWRTYVMQVACYAASVPYDTAADRRISWEEAIGDFAPSQEWAVIAHLPTDEALAGKAVCRLVLCDIAAGRDAIENIVMPMASWRERTDLLGVAHPDEPLIEVDVNSTPSRTARECLRTTHGGRRLVSMDSTDAFDGLDGPSALDRPGTPERRAFLDARIQHLKTQHPEAFAVFVIAVTDAGIAPLMASTSHTVRELKRLEQLIVDAEWAHGITPTTTLIPTTPPHEGAALSPQEVTDLASAYTSTGQAARAAVDAWRLEAAAAGFELGLNDRQTERRRANLLARMACASPDIEPDMIRAAIAHVMGEDWPLMPGITLGACFGALTIDEARRLVDMAPSLPERRDYQTDWSGITWLAVA